MGCTGSRFDEMPVTGHPHGIKVLPGSERSHHQSHQSHHQHYQHCHCQRQNFQHLLSLSPSKFSQIHEKDEENFSEFHFIFPFIPAEFSQVHDEGADGAEVEREVLQLQWRRLHHQGYGGQRLVQVM